MKLTFLGTGTSCGVPVIGCNCEVCRSADPHDKRMRSSVLIESDNSRILIDCGPDFYHQALRMPFQKIDAVLLTHKHYDHVGGLDDIRPFFYKFGDIQIYANKDTADAIHRTMPYSFGENLYPGVPRLKMNVIEPNEPFCVGDIPVMPIEVMHKTLPILAYRIGKHFAYITDMKSIDDSQLQYLTGIDTLVVNALRFVKSHPSHIIVDEAIEFSRKIGAKRTYFTHTTHDIGLHDIANSKLPDGFSFAYDEQQIEVE